MILLSNFLKNLSLVIIATRKEKFNECKSQSFICWYGGTGVHVGKEFELALRRDLCGPDGKSLIKRGGAFKSLKPYQLPDYIQSLYFDFDDDAEKTSSTRSECRVFKK